MKPRSSASSGPYLHDANDDWQISDRRYLSEASVAKFDPASVIGPVAAIGAGD